jgi:hypothetical protein
MMTTAGSRRVVAVNVVVPVAVDMAVIVIGC